MAFENEAISFIDAWLGERYENATKAVVDGSPQDFAAYKERVGYLRCLKDINGALEDFVKKTNEGIRSGKA